MHITPLPQEKEEKAIIGLPVLGLPELEVQVA